MECDTCGRHFSNALGFGRHRRRVNGELACRDPAELDMHQDAKGAWRANGPSEDERDWVRRTTGVRSGRGS